ncbi:MAG: membrane protein insertase YidC [Clostridia bacterium]|nr:membrane protein insertase YidC [Clostridia bacterium]
MGIFDYIAYPFAYPMRWFYSFTGNYALALLLFAVLVKIVLLPLAIKQQKNQQKQAALRPLEMAIRKRYAGRTDRPTQQKMQGEIMELYQQQGYSPFSGCLPLLVQFPVIIALYQIVRSPLTYIVRLSSESVSAIVEALGGSAAGFSASNEIALVSKIHELGDAVPEAIRSLGEYGKITALNFKMFGLNLAEQPKFSEPSWLWLIPLIVFATSFFGMKLSRKFMPQQGAAAAASADAQASGKIMDFTMPLMSTFFSFMFAGAIGVYWIYQNVLNAAQTVILAKVMPLPKFTEEDYKAAERQLAGKAPKKKKASDYDPDRPRPRSLHHIDDEDELPPRVPEPEEEPEDAGSAEPENPDAPRLKDDRGPRYKLK